MLYLRSRLGLLVFVLASVLAAAAGTASARPASATAATTLSAVQITSDTTWRLADSPFEITNYVTVARGATLTVEPGVEVRFAPNAVMTVAGSLQAIGEASAPITFTGTQKNPGSWQGITFYGNNESQAIGVLSHTVVEYGGFGSTGGNIYVNIGQVTISDSTIRQSAGSGIVLWSRAAGSSITRSSIVGNAKYGFYIPQGVNWQAPLAINNWWGDPSGPTTDNGCNANGQGARVSTGVAYSPFLAAADAEITPLTPAAARLLSITPERWYAPADGITKVYVALTLRDGAGNPVPGRTVRLHSTLGQVTDGGITDARGQTNAWLVSTAAGNAELAAELDTSSECEYARSSTAMVAFNNAESDPLDASSVAPYISTNLNIGPQPVTQGVPATLSAQLSNPGNEPLLVEGRFAFAQSGIGLTFGPLGSSISKVIQPGETATFSTTFLPPLEGHYCFTFDYTYTSASSNTRAAVAARGGHMQINSVFAPNGRPPMPNFLDGVQPGPDQLPWQPEEGIDASLSFFFRNPIAAINYWTTDKTDKKPPFTIPGGPRTFASRATSQPEYRVISPPRSYTAAQRPASDPISAARRAAEQTAAQALADAAAALEANALAEYRYQQAVEAHDMQWASLQASAADVYGKQAAAALRTAANALTAYVQVLASEGLTSHLITPEQAAAYQQRLLAQGFTTEEISGMRQLGLSDPAIEDFRQRQIASTPEQLSGDMIARLVALAGIYQGMASDLEATTFFADTAPTTNAAPSQIAAQANMLSQSGTITRTIQIGNPFGTTTTIDLRMRPMALPQDWSVSASPSVLTLAPGEQRTVTVTIVPGTAVEGETVQAAIEGFANGQLIDGVAFTIPVPRRVALTSAFQVYTPLMQR